MGTDLNFKLFSGCGKTMLMDLFHDQCPVKNKQRVHFHKFMLDVHQSMYMNFYVKNKLSFCITWHISLQCIIGVTLCVKLVTLTLLLSTGVEPSVRMYSVCILGTLKM